MSYEDRARGALFGLAVGDAMGWPALYHRTYTLPFWTRRLRREIDAAQESQGILRFPMPFSLNRPTEALQFAPTDDTEWASFTMEALVETAGELTAEVILEKWRALSDQEVRGSISVLGALHNLRRGALPPVTGSDNAHYFDDSACLRAVPIGVVWQGDREKILQLVELDAQVTNSRDGLWAAQALAVVVGTLCSGAGLEEALELGQAVLPEDSWVARTVNLALEIVQKSGASSPFTLIPQLDRLINKEYSYGGAAPEVLALAFAITRLVECHLEQGVLLALAFPKLADSLPAVVGALCGAKSGCKHSNLQGWLPSIAQLQGICLPQLAGRDYLGLVDEVVALGTGLGRTEVAE